MGPSHLINSKHFYKGLLSFGAAALFLSRFSPGLGGPMNPKQMEEVFLKWAYVWSVGQQKVNLRQQAQQAEQSLLKNRRDYE